MWQRLMWLLLQWYTGKATSVSYERQACSGRQQRLSSSIQALLPVDLVNTLPGLY